MSSEAQTFYILNLPQKTHLTGSSQKHGSVGTQGHFPGLSVTKETIGEGPMPLCDLTRIYDKSLVVPFYYCFKFNIDTTIFTLLGRSHHLLEPSPSVLSMHMYEIICTVQGNALLSLLAATAKSLQSCPTLCDPIDGSPPGSPPSLGFSRQDHWSGLPFPSPMHESEK